MQVRRITYLSILAYTLESLPVRIIRTPTEVPIVRDRAIPICRYTSWCNLQEIIVKAGYYLFFVRFPVETLFRQSVEN